MNGASHAGAFAPHHQTEKQAIEFARMLIHAICEFGPRPEIAVVPHEMPTPALGELLAEVLRSLKELNRTGWQNLLVEIIARNPGQRGDELRIRLVEACEAPLVCEISTYVTARRFVLSHHRVRRKWELAQAITAAIDTGESTAKLTNELSQLEALGSDDHATDPEIIHGVMSYPSDFPADNTILGNGWLRRSDLATFISTAGAGKSVAVTQAAMAWGLGLTYLGICPPRPLHILLFSGEDDAVTIGQCRDGLLKHAESITGKSIGRKDLASLDDRLRIDFSREHVGTGFHSRLARLLSQQPADLVIINPMLSFVGGEIVACASEWLRAGLMPILKSHGCAALVASHTVKLAKDGWDQVDDTYSAIGGSELGNAPRAILVLRPTASAGLSVLKVAKRQTTGWTDDNGKPTDRFFLRRSGDPECPAWIPVETSEAETMISANKRTAGNSRRKVTIADVQSAIGTASILRQDLIKRIVLNCNCGNTVAKRAISDALSDRAIVASAEPNPKGGKPMNRLSLPTQGTKGQINPDL